jgi:glutathione peroxidase
MACDAGQVNPSDLAIRRLDGSPATLGTLMDGRAALVVNVASQCEYTPQYATLEALFERYADRGLTIIGVPCNQFDRQEPGTSEEIATFCSTTYGVTFPLTEKVDVNGLARHPIYGELVKQPYDDGVLADVDWNFEKFLLAKDGRVLRRFRPETEPDDPVVIQAIDSLLAE